MDHLASRVVVSTFFRDPKILMRARQLKKDAGGEGGGGWGQGDLTVLITIIPQWLGNSTILVNRSLKDFHQHRVLLPYFNVHVYVCDSGQKIAFLITFQEKFEFFNERLVKFLHHSWMIHLPVRLQFHPSTIGFVPCLHSAFVTSSCCITFVKCKVALKLFNLEQNN